MFCRHNEKRLLALFLDALKLRKFQNESGL